MATCAEPCVDGEAVTVMIRPERVAIDESTGDAVPNALPGVVSRLTYRGAHTMVTLDCDDLNLEAQVANVHGEPPDWLDPGRSVRVTLSPAALRVMPRQAVAAAE
jgi:ABC-type Fe3+/spermidine/putrescine transport system ATPase subunit